VAAAAAKHAEAPPVEGAAEAAVLGENAVFKTINGSPEYKIGPGDNLEVTFWEAIPPTARRSWSGRTAGSPSVWWKI